MDRRTLLCLHVAGLQRQVFKHVKILSEQSKEMKQQKLNQGSFLVAESAYNSQIAQYGLVIMRCNKTYNSVCQTIISLGTAYRNLKKT